MKKINSKLKQIPIKSNLLAILVLLALAWLFFHSELNKPEIHEQVNQHFDYCLLIAIAIQSHQLVFYKVVLYAIPTFYIEKQLITSIKDQNYNSKLFSSKSLPLALINSQLLI